VNFLLSIKPTKINLWCFRILMPARRHTFTAENIRAAWEAVGIIPFNPRRVLGVVKRKETKIVVVEHAGQDAAPPVPKTP